MPLRPKASRDQIWPSLIPLRNGEPLQAITLTDPSILIGSGEAAQIRLRSKLVSKAHALLLVDKGTAYIRDLASRTHLFVNEEPVREAVLTDGDVVRVGTFRFEVAENASAAGVHLQPPPVRVAVGGGHEEVRQVVERVVLVGSRPGCDVMVADESVSRGHAVLFWVNHGWHVRDLGSRTGTRVNGTTVRQQTEVAEGDVIGFGAADLQYLGPVEAPATPVEPLVVPEASAEAWVEPIAPVGPPVDAVSLLAPAEGVWGREPIRAAAVSDVKPPPGEPPLSEIDHATAAIEQGGHGVSFDSTDLPGGAAAEPVGPTGEPALSGVVPSRAEPTKSSEPVPAVEAPIAARAAAPSTEAADEPRPAKPAVATGVGGLPALLEWRPEARPSFLESSHVSVHEPAGAGAEDVPADEGTPGAVTVWGFDELARRVQADRAGPAPDNASPPLSGWRRWRRVLLAAGLVCAVCGMLIAAMVLHKLL